MDADLDLAATRNLRYMSLPAAATSGLVHALAALAVIRSLPPRPVETIDRAIDVTLEPVTPPPAQPIEARPEPAPPRPAPLAERLLPAPEPPPVFDAAAAFPPPPELSKARLEEALPPVDEPPPFSTRELVRIAPARKPAPLPAVQREPVQQASTARAESERRAQEDYLMHVIQKLSRYRYYPKSREVSEHGVVVTRLTVARDGHLLDVELAKSSGYPSLDRGVMDTIRRASPFAPLPAELADGQMSFIVPISYNRER